MNVKNDDIRRFTIAPMFGETIPQFAMRVATLTHKIPDGHALYAEWYGRSQREVRVEEGDSADDIERKLREVISE